VLQGLGANSLPHAAETLRKVRWLLVDEIQDLVGVRARLVVLLMRKVLASGGAVSLFGDPAQSIYDFQVQDGWNSARFLACNGSRSIAPIKADFVTLVARSLALSPPSSIISKRSSPSRVRFAAPNNGAPLTAPGRSEKPFLIREKGPW